jgi:phosphoglycolate phosphatase-like HAD superfamily hydrolase
MSSRSAAFALLLTTSLPLFGADRTEEWRQDLTVLAAELKRVHPRFRECGLTPDFEAQRAALSARLGGLSDAQAVVEIQRLLASVGDGHTLLWPFGMKKGTLLRLPLMLWSFEEGLYVIDASDRDLIGKRVVHIGGVPTAEVLGRLEPFVSHDNAEQVLWAAPFYATLTDFLAAVGATSDRNAAILSFDDGGRAAVRAAPIDPASLREKLIAPNTAAAPLYLSRAEDAFWAAELPGGVLYVQINTMNDGRDETLAAFAIALRQRVAGFRAVAVDLRLNNGGEASKADELLRTLIAADTQGVRLAVLTSRMTFSAAQTFAARIDQWTGAVFVGQPTGSNRLVKKAAFRFSLAGSSCQRVEV